MRPVAGWVDNLAVRGSSVSIESYTTALYTIAGNLTGESPLQPRCATVRGNSLRDTHPTRMQPLQTTRHNSVDGVWVQRLTRNRR
jgi:hypothetical protein